MPSFVLKNGEVHNLEFSDLKELLTFFQESDIRVLELKNTELSLYLNKDQDTRGLSSHDNQTVAPVIQSQEKPISTNEISPSSAEVEPAAEVKGHMITSPLVGLAYLQASPDAPPFKKVGDAVAEGEVVCIIEAMKIMNEITSDRSGTVKSIHVDNEEVVEFGQPLIEII